MSRPVEHQTEYYSFHVYPTARDEWMLNAQRRRTGRPYSKTLSSRTFYLAVSTPDLPGVLRAAAQALLEEAERISRPSPPASAGPEPPGGLQGEMP